ncbi:MAG: hypothetical protein H6835_10330 [Planctomycetes bacterium]|nr:hypothetical protein [Planctomycetota bacterium]
MQAWLTLDFFGDARRAGGGGSGLTTTIMWQALLAVIFAALLYPDVPPIPFAAANLCLSTLLVGIGSLADDERPLRRAADDALLATSPITRTTAVLARATHATFHLLLVTTGMALPPAILLAHLRGDPLQALGYVIAAGSCSALASGGLATLRSVLARMVGGERATLVMGSMKALLLGAGFVLFVLGLQRLGKDADALPIGRLGAELLPPYHAARLLWAPVAEGWRLLPWLGLAGGMLVVTVLLSRAATPSRVQVGGVGPLRRLLGVLAGRGPRLAVADFVAISMWRSAGFRARVLPLLGLPAGMVFLTMRDGQHGYVMVCLLLQLPAIYLPFLIAFLPRADQAGTGWIFTHAPGLDLATVRDATWRALVTHVLLPVHGVAIAVLLAVGPERGDRTAAAVFALGLSALAARPMVSRLARVPFSVDQEEDQGLEMGALMAGALVLGGLGTLFGALVPVALRWPAAAAAVGVAVMALRQRPTADGAPIVSVAVAADGVAPDTSPAPATVSGAPDAAGAVAVPPTVGRELRAVWVLYAVLSVLPWLIGAAFAP